MYSGSFFAEHFRTIARQHILEKSLSSVIAEYQFYLDKRVGGLRFAGHNVFMDRQHIIRFEVNEFDQIRAFFLGPASSDELSVANSQTRCLRRYAGAPDETPWIEYEARDFLASGVLARLSHLLDVALESRRSNSKAYPKTETNSGVGDAKNT